MGERGQMFTCRTSFWTKVYLTVKWLQVLQAEHVVIKSGLWLFDERKGRLTPCKFASLYSIAITFHLFCMKYIPPVSPRGRKSGLSSFLISVWRMETLSYSFLNPYAYPDGSEVKLPANAGDVGLIPGSGRSPREGNGNLLQYSCLENPINRGGWWLQSLGLQRDKHDRVTEQMNEWILTLVAKISRK